MDTLILGSFENILECQEKAKKEQKGKKEEKEKPNKKGTKFSRC